MATGSEFYSFPRGALSEAAGFKGWPPGNSTADADISITDYITGNSTSTVAIATGRSFLIIDAFGCGGNGGSSTDYSGGGQAGSYSFLKIPLFGMDGQLTIYVASSGSTANTTVTGIVAGRYVNIVCPPGGSASGTTGGTGGVISTGGSVNRLGGNGANGNGTTSGGGGGGAPDYFNNGGAGGAPGPSAGTAPGGGSSAGSGNLGGGGGGGGWRGRGGDGRLPASVTAVGGTDPANTRGNPSTSADGGDGGAWGGGGGGKGAAGTAGIGGRGGVRLTLI